MKGTLAATLAALAAHQAHAADPQLKFLANLSVKHPGFVSSVDHGGQYRDLLVSAFNGIPYSTDYVYAFPEFGSNLNRIGNLSPVTLTTNSGKMVWPNEIDQASEKLFGQKGMLVSGGFLVTTKGDGAVWFATVDKAGNFGKLNKLTTSSGWFYHRAVAFDVNRDGQLDILTCHAKKPLIGSGSGELMWLEPKNRTNPISGGWTERKLNTACDVFFHIQDLDGDGIEEIMVADFFKEKVTLLWTEDKVKGFSNEASIKSRVIDSAIGPVFDIEVVDLNLDGRLDVLVTNHQGTKDKPGSSVFVYELPTKGDIRTGEWTKRVIASNFPTLVSGIGQASPGAAHTFRPTGPVSSALVNQGDDSITAEAVTRPWIILAGDGNEKAYILKPKSESSSVWDYDIAAYHDCKSTVGGIHVADVDRDGYMEVFTPCYDEGYIAVHTFKP